MQRPSACRAEEKLTKHHVWWERMKEIRAGARGRRAARAPGIVSLASRLSTTRENILEQIRPSVNVLVNDARRGGCRMVHVRCGVHKHIIERGSGCGQGRACAVCALLVLAMTRDQEFKPLLHPRLWASAGAQFRQFGGCECNRVHNREPGRGVTERLSQAKVQCREDRGDAKGVAVGGGGGHGRRLVRLSEVRLE